MIDPSSSSVASFLASILTSRDYYPVWRSAFATACIIRCLSLLPYSLDLPTLPSPRFLCRESLPTTPPYLFPLPYLSTTVIRCFLSNKYFLHVQLHIELTHRTHAYISDSCHSLLAARIDRNALDRYLWSIASSSIRLARLVSPRNTSQQLHNEDQTFRIDLGFIVGCDIYRRGAIWQFVREYTKGNNSWFVQLYSPRQRSCQWLMSAPGREIPK